MTISSSFEKSRWRFLEFFSSRDRSAFSLKPPTKSSLGRVSSKGVHTKYTERAFLVSLCSERYFARNTPPRDYPIRMALFRRRGKYRSKAIFQSRYFALSCRGIRGLMISNLLPNFFSRSASQYGFFSVETFLVFK